MRPDVRQWFERRTSAVGDWPVDQLLAAKGATTISVVLPALDEEATVGAIVAAIRRELVERAPLVDEVVVMDSGSTDRTAEVARDAGAVVVARDDVLPRFTPVPGKGEVMWRSLAATRGDVLVFVDADLHDFDPAFVTGLLGPLLADPGVDLVKGLYERPLLSGQTVLPAGGGRVTELVARPLLNLHWPQLSGFVQPLAGECAARRGLLERLPFPCGYGVETGLLVGALELVGLDGLAQVDLGVRRHRNQTDAALGRMAAEILLAAERRLHPTPGRGREVGGSRLTQFEREGEVYRERTVEVEGIERPPICTVPEYAARLAG